LDLKHGADGLPVVAPQRNESWSPKPFYTAKNGKSSKIFPALEWLAAMCSHIPNRGEQMVRYYGYYSNASRGKRLKEGSDVAIP